MDAEQLTGYTTWRWLWTHTAQQIIAVRSLPSCYQSIQISYGWGVCSHTGQTILLLHPSGANRMTGDLTLSILGQPSSVIARNDRTYVEYIQRVTEIVEQVL